MRLLSQDKAPDGRASVQSRGMALMAGIMMFVLVGAAVLSLMIVFTSEARRTRATVTGPQLRQCLLAGAVETRMELEQHGTGARDVPLKVPLVEMVTTLHIAPEGERGAVVRITAAYRDARASEELHWTHGANNSWAIVRAALHD